MKVAYASHFRTRYQHSWTSDSNTMVGILNSVCDWVAARIPRNDEQSDPPFANSPSYVEEIYTIYIIEENDDWVDSGLRITASSSQSAYDIINDIFQVGGKFHGHRTITEDTAICAVWKQTQSNDSPPGTVWYQPQHGETEAYFTPHWILP